MKAGEFLNKLATKSGISSTDKALVDLLSKSEFANAEIPDEMANTIETSLMTAEAAKSHPEVIKKIKSEALNGADAVIDRMLKENGYDEAEIADIKNDKNTYQRIEKTLKYIKDAEAKKAGASAPDKAALQKQIDELHGKLKTTIEGHEKSVKEIQSKYEGEMIDLEVQGLLAAKKYSLPEEMSPALKHQIALNAVKAELTAKGFQIVKNPNTKTLEVKRLDGSDAYDAKNNKIDLTQLVDGALAQNQLLQVSKQDPVPPVPPIPGGKPPVVNQQAIDMIDQAIADAGGAK